MRRAPNCLLPAPRIAGSLLGVLALAALFASTGLGASSSTEVPEAAVVSALSLTDPVALTGTPAVCSDTLAPLDTDDCGDVSFASGSLKVLRLGALAGTDVQAGALQWSVTTTNATGYRVHMSNVGAAPLMQSGANAIPDMSTSTLVAASAVDDATHFGVAMGDSVADNQASVDFPGSPWVTAGGQQGELFSGVPVGGRVIAERATPQTNDPFTATFAAAAVASQQPASGAYAGTIRITAAVI